MGWWEELCRFLRSAEGTPSFSGEMKAAARRTLIFGVILVAILSGAAFAATPSEQPAAAVDHSQHLHPAAAAAAQAPLLGGGSAVTASVPAAPGPFLATFDGTPSAPAAVQNMGWDIVPTGFDRRQVGTAVQVAQHGPACDRPGFPYISSNTHAMATSRDTVFICNDHLMTATGLSGYGAIYMIPPALADFSSGSTTISWDMSTLRTAARDWVYFTIMPFDGHNKFAYNNSDQAIPPDNINVKLGGTNALLATERVSGGGDVSIGGDDFTTWDMVQAANGLVEDAARRDSFVIDLSATHLRVCLTGNNTGAKYTYKGSSPFCWVDADLPTALSSSVWHGQAVFMITHVSYNAEKSCSSAEDQFSIVHNPTGDAECPPDTWHWDNVGINPAIPFTILNPEQQYAQFGDPSGGNTVTFSTPAPADAHLSYIGAGDCTAQRFSVDGGATWIRAIPQPATTQCQHPENGGEYWTPIPEGATSVKFTGTGAFGGGQFWGAEGISIWAGGGTFPSNPGTTPPQQPAPPPPAQQPPAQQIPSDTGFHSAWVDQSAYPTLAPGTVASVSLRFRNSGTQTWQRGVAGRQVNLGVAGDDTGYAPLGLGWLSPNRPATTQEAAVGPGQIGTFSFSVRAPSAQGSYRIPLRLVADGVTWLDDQGVYVVVVSDGGFHSAWLSQSDWPVMRPGETSTPINIVFRNTGSQVWQKGSPRQANLGISDDDTSWSPLGVGWPSRNRPAIQSEDTVAPGGTATFTFQIVAPSIPGAYELDLRPVIDGITWLEDDGVYVLITVQP
jgi:hypothetical protein